MEHKIILGDCLQELNKLDNKSIALLITDPPYGINYKSNRRKYENNVTVDIKGDKNIDEALQLFKLMLDIVKDKLVDNAHLYVFCSWKNYSKFKEIIEEYYQIKNVLVWDKGNHGAGDLQGNYGERYELIIFAGNGSRIINSPRPVNILKFSKIPGIKLKHPTEKPVKLIQYLIEKSTVPGELVLDPFMGVGTVLKACTNRNPCIGIEIDEYFYSIAVKNSKQIYLDGIFNF